MAPDTDNSIEALLEQRSQYEQWLAKLDSAANKAPDAVRKKVRADYEVRLRGVIERLRGHSASATRAPSASWTASAGLRRRSWRRPKSATP